MPFAVLKNYEERMFLAPLNADHFFRKAFSDLNTAKAFLQDVLGVVIEDIKRLPLKKKLSDDAVVVEFDFRCIIDGQPVIIEMQRGYLDDVVLRFYLYFAACTALQLENLPLKEVTTRRGKLKKVASYEGVEPVITLIWMAEDCLGTSENFLSFSMLPEAVASFVKNEENWINQDWQHLARQREKLLAMLNNQTKSMGFLSKNRLIFAFQKNIVKNKPASPYFKWFDFAEKTRNHNNRKEDFKQYLNDKDMNSIIQRINQEVLDEEDFSYIEEFETERRAGRVEGREEGRVEGFEEGLKIGEARGEAKGEARGIEIGEAKGIEIGVAKNKAEEQEKRRQEKLEIARTLKQNGVAIEVIMTATKLSRKVIEKL